MTYYEFSPQEQAILDADEALEQTSRPSAWLNEARDVGSTALATSHVVVRTHDEEVAARRATDEDMMFYQQSAE